MKKLKLWWSDDSHKMTLFAIAYFVIACVNWLQITTLGNRISNNFRIFTHGFYHLSNAQPLYIEYPAEHFDYFFYNPVFAFFFGIFAKLPENLGIFLWLIFLTFVFFKASINMPFRKGFMWIFLILVISEFSKNLRHVQPNILNCALMLFVFLSFEKKRPALAAFLCALLFCIKGYGVIVGALCFFYPKPWKTIIYGILSLVLLSALPLSIVSFSTLQQYYIDWLSVVRSETIIEPFCLMGFAQRTLHWANSESIIMGFGLAMMALYGLSMIVRRAFLTIDERAMFLGFLLMWVVAFNRSAESPTYIYAVVGSIIVYYFSKPNRIWTLIFGVCFYVISILVSDLSFQFLKDINNHYFIRPLFILPLLLFAFLKDMQRSYLFLSSKHE